MPPKKKVTFNLPPLPPPLPPLPRRNRAASIRNVRASLQAIAPPPPSLPRPPRSRPLKRSTGMHDLTRIPKQKGGAFTMVQKGGGGGFTKVQKGGGFTKVQKGGGFTKVQKGGAFTREMNKKLFLDKLTRPSRPSVTRTSKPRKKPKKHRETKDVANKRMQQFQKLRNLAHPPMRAAKVSAKKKLKEHRALRNLAKIDRARKIQRGDWKRLRNLDMEPTATKVVRKRVSKKKPKRQAKVTAKKRIAQFNKLRALAGHPSKPKQKRSTQWKRLRKLDVKPRPNESAEDTMKRQLLQTARQEISHLSSQKIKALSGPTRITKNKHFLDALQQVEAKHRKQLIKGATTEQINTISEVALNILQGNVPLKPHHKKKLNKHKTSLRALASKGVSVEKRKKIINQQGGTIIPALAFFLAKYYLRHR